MKDKSVIIKKAKKDNKKFEDKINNKKWFIIFKENLIKLDAEKRIELNKYLYDLDIQTSKWLLGIGIGMFAAVNLSGIVKLKSGFFYIAGIAAYILSPILFIIGIILLVKGMNRQKIKMRYLFKKLKRESNKK